MIRLNRSAASGNKSKRAAKKCRARWTWTTSALWPTACPRLLAKALALTGSPCYLLIHTLYEKLSYFRCSALKLPVRIPRRERRNPRNIPPEFPPKKVRAAKNEVCLAGRAPVPSVSLQTSRVALGDDVFRDRNCRRRGDPGDCTVHEYWISPDDSGPSPRRIRAHQFDAPRRRRHRGLSRACRTAEPRRWRAQRVAGHLSDGAALRKRPCAGRRHQRVRPGTRAPHR